jgi:hypothetical protein
LSTHLGAPDVRLILFSFAETTICAEAGDVTIQTSVQVTHTRQLQRSDVMLLLSIEIPARQLGKSPQTVWLIV